MSAYSYRTISVQCDSPVKEALAGGTITPGFLIAYTSTGTVVVHPDAGKDACALFAIEDDLQGKGISDNYSSGNNVRFRMFQPGDIVFAYLANGQNVTRHAMLESNGAGYLRVHTASSAGVVEYPKAIIGEALESVNASGGASRILVMIW